MANYLVRQQGTSVYIHYNPHEEAYVGLEQENGAAMFTQEMGNDFLATYGPQLPGQWEVISIQSVMAPGTTLQHISVDAFIGGTEEQKLFDATHS